MSGRSPPLYCTLISITMYSHQPSEFVTAGSRIGWVSFAGCQSSTATLNSLHCSIGSKVEVNFADDVYGFDTRRAPRNCSRFVCWWYGFDRDFLDSVYVPILLYCCTRIAVRCPGDNSIRLRRTDASRQNSTTTNMHAACRIVTRGSCCTKRFAESNGNCESYCNLELLVAL